MENNNTQKLIYLNRRRSDIEELKDNLKNQKLDSFLNVGHKLKGHGDSFGFPEISRIGLEMEKAALAKDFEKIKSILLELEKTVEGIIAYIENG